jgi:hypothetical protein
MIHTRRQKGFLVASHSRSSNWPGYIEPLGHGKWRTTEQGELLGGGKTPRFTRDSVEQALSGLKERIQTINADESAPYRIARAVAFGDFLGDRVRVQAVTVGIGLERHSGAGDDRPTAAARREEDAFLKQLNKEIDHSRVAAIRSLDEPSILPRLPLSSGKFLKCWKWSDKTDGTVRSVKLLTWMAVGRRLTVYWL